MCVCVCVGGEWRRAEFLPPGSLSEIAWHISSLKAIILHQIDSQSHEHFPRHLPLISVPLALNYLCYKFNIGLLYPLVALIVSQWCWRGGVVVVVVVVYITLHPLVF